MTRATAAARYRDVGVTTRVLSASGIGLTTILYEELADTLRLAQRPGDLARAGTRALAMIAELDATLDEAPPSDFVRSMRAIHAHATREAGAGLREAEPKRMQNALVAIQPIAEAWSSLRSSV